MATVFYFLLAFSQLCLAASLGYGIQTLTVATVAGDVVGVARELDGKGYRVFAGIPYAEPPVGPLRFSDPIAKSAWDGVLNATSFGRACPQTLSKAGAFNPDYVVKIPEEAMEISEDCLTLNVYAPTGHEGNMTDGLAVMVWVHGGGYRHGQGSAYDASALSVQGGVVVVTINYRLGPFGFLFTGDDSAKGNYGLKDQQLALKWVRDNIMGFGGDPGRVTLFGQSDVFESIRLHSIAKNSRSLFHRMIIHSPKWQSVWPDNPTAESFTDVLNCPSENTNLLVECLRGKTVEEILDANKQVIDAEKSSYIWYPVFNEDFFNEKPGDGIKHDFLSVLNSGDGSIGLDLLRESLHLQGGASNLTTGVTEEQFDDWFGSYTEDSGVSELAIKEHYIPNDIMDKDLARMKALVDIYLDWNSIRYNAEYLDDLKSNLSSIFMMVFDHRSSFNDKYPALDLVPHGEELAYVLGLPFIIPGIGESFTTDERNLSRCMMKFWSNFAKTGDPNDDGVTDPHSNCTIWPEYGDSKKYLQISQNEEGVGSDYRGEEVHFWNEYLPELNEAAEELCPREAATTTRSSAKKTPRPTAEVVDECGEKVTIGENLGLDLSPKQAEDLIGTMLFVVVALLCLIVLVTAVAVGFMYKLKGVGQMTEVSVEKGTAPKNHYEPNGHVRPSVESGTQASTYENLPVGPVLHTTEINHTADQNDSEDEAGPLQEKHAIPDSDDEFPHSDDEMPHYASVNKSHRPEEDQTATSDEVEFPPPPDDWQGTKSDEAGDEEEHPPPEDASLPSSDTENPTEEDAEQDQNPSNGTRSEDAVSDPSTEPADDEDTKV